MNFNLYLFLTSILFGFGENVLAQERTLINGRTADPKDFPASVVASMSGAACTATVVGERVLFIAAHCVADSPRASFTIGPNKYTTTCKITPRYARGVDHDLALCLTDRPVQGIAFESINVDASILKVGGELLLTGYGCVRPGGSGGNDGVYRIGEAKISALPSNQSFDIETTGGGALCYGDSGGPAFKFLDSAKTQRVVVSANSKGDIQTMSYLASTSTPESIDFFNSWASQNNVKICGVHKDAQNCRSGAVPNGGGSSQPKECLLMTQQNALQTWGQCVTFGNSMDLVACDRANDLIQDCFAYLQK